MTKNKDQKRLIRARMKKTGESYTAARAVIVSRQTRDDGAHAPRRAQWPALAGISDAKVSEKTGRTWAEWVALLDAAGARKLSHRDIARHVLDKYADVGGWWSQMVTVGYERICGLREVGQGRDGRYQAGKSRTFAVKTSKLYRMFRDARLRLEWLPEGVTRVRTAVENKSIRFDWHDGTQVNVFFVSKGPAKSLVSIDHAKLASRADVMKAKSYWNDRLKTLDAVLKQ